ncbi:MAG TPA: ATP-binding protein [Candidatus Angelobacter sp.]
MATSIDTVMLRNERDVVVARQRARDIAALLGYDNRQQIRLATAASEMARNAFRYARNGKVSFGVALDAQRFEIVISDSGPGIANLNEILEGRYHSETGLGLGIIGTKRLMDTFTIETGGSGTRITMGQALAPAITPLLPQHLQDTIRDLKTRLPEGPYEEIQRQNQELLKILEELRARQEELALLNRELEDTNRGVVALYAELDERADYLRRASDLKSSFLSNISHEFRTPLNSIVSLARILLDRMDGQLTQEQEKQVRFIADAAKSLSEMVNDLLDLAKVEAGKVKIRVKTFEVSELFSALKGMLKPLLADNTSVDLVFDEVSPIPPLHTDEGKVSQILRNFISNAIKFTAKGEVKISAEPGVNQSILFKVMDTGIGIAAEHQDAIFQEFTQIDNPFQDNYRGTGLGLPLCRNLALLLGGKVWVESELGQGSAFYAEIPVVYRGEAEASQAEEPLPVPDFHRLPVLLVEDNPEIFSVLEPYFRRSEFQLIHVQSIDRAQQWLARHTAEAIVSDIYLDGSPSWDFLASLKKQYRNAEKKVPLIAISIYEHESRALSAGADVFLKKPLPEDLLMRELRRLTGRQKPRRVLLVDDNDLELYILRELLDRPWLDLIEARSGPQALETISSEHPDAVILDLTMPGMSGFEVLERLRANEQTRDLPVIVYTSRILSGEERQRLDRLGAQMLFKGDIATTLAPEVILNSLERIGVSEPQRS